jgi:NADH dehydrogenase [ubiquinone] 1 alpha subcomplex assembly factor 7
MTALPTILCELIAREGPMTLERYMDLALQHPEHGYYRNRDPLGKEGDFITAPEVSQVFGELLGLWCADVWHQMGKPDPFMLLELGPGRGTMMQDALRATAKIAGFHEAMRLHLLECNAELRRQQQERLAAHKPVHLDDLSQLPPLPMIALANEFFDTMPIRQFVKTKDGWRERLVDVQDGALTFGEGEVAVNVLETIENVMQDVRVSPANVVRLHGEPDGELQPVYEISPLSLYFAQRLSAHVVRHGGAGLIVDYGYTAPPGTETLQAVKRHHFVGVFESPGETDLTAYVDFSALRLIAGHEGARVAGPVVQGEFLRSLGAELRAMQLKHNAAPEQTKSIDEALSRLIDPAQMGQMFKAMAVCSPQLREVAGFP